MLINYLVDELCCEGGKNEEVVVDRYAGVDLMDE